MVPEAILEKLEPMYYLSVLSWDLQFHASYLFILDNSYKSSNMLQVGQIKHCIQFPCGPTLPAVFTFFCLVCGCLLKKKQKTKKNKQETNRQNKQTKTNNETKQTMKQNKQTVILELLEGCGASIPHKYSLYIP